MTFWYFKEKGTTLTGFTVEKPHYLIGSNSLCVIIKRYKATE